MDKSKEEKPLLTQSWQKAFKSGTDLDTWGQPVEAAMEYERLAKAIRQILVSDSVDESPMFNDDEKKILSKVVTCLELRSRALKQPGGVQGISLVDIKHIQSNLASLVASRPSSFPVDVVAAQAYVHAQTRDGLLPVSPPEVVDDEEDPANRRARGNLMGRLVPQEGRTVVAVRVEKIGLKDAASLIDSHLVISVKDQQGRDVTPVQSTPFVSQKTDSYIVFNIDVFIQRHLEALPKDFAIFFELKHYKPKKQQLSTKCWALLERDEINEGPVVLELYKKPTDPKRKRIQLLTAKPLFLHLKLSLN